MSERNYPRGKLEVVYDILRNALMPSAPTTLMRKAGLNYYFWRDYLNCLHERGLIEKLSTPRGSNARFFVCISSEGRQLLRQLEQAYRMLGWIEGPAQELCTSEVTG